MVSENVLVMKQRQFEYNSNCSEEVESKQRRWLFAYVNSTSDHFLSITISRLAVILA